ncbi:MAG: PilZ domain-containing protein [Xanthomonadaceae bacterium]|nr:PilZ domain-containing protein [Xanthomonadaceae bacterium]
MAKTPVGSEIIDFKSAQQEKLEEKRRKNQRIIFKNMMGVYGITGDKKLNAIELLDLSDNGISFRIPFNVEKLWPTDSSDITIRLYFTQDTYIPLRVKIQNSKSMIEEGIKYTRYGCVVEKSGSSFETYKKFVEFTKAYSTESYQDQGGVQVFYI